VLKHKKISRANAEHHYRMTVEPIFETTEARERQIFLHRERVDVADAAPFQIAGGGVMNGMGAAPNRKG
jgi:hypothetical protein